LAANAANTLHVVSGYEIDNLKMLDETTSQADIGADLAAINLLDDDWYCLLLAMQPKADIEAAAAVIETLKKILLCNSGDNEIVSSSSSDVLSYLKSHTYNRTALCFHAAIGEHMGAAWAGVGLNYDPGTITWMFKIESGVTVNVLTAAQIAYIKGKNGNWFINTAGINITYQGMMASGQFIDVTNSIDWLQSRIQESVFSAFVNNNKIPFTNDGIALVKGLILGVLRQGVRIGMLSDTPAPAVYAPQAGDVSSTDKSNRLLPDVSFTATLAGAVHSVVISGTLSL
jgi:hypothetical protein